MDISIFGLGYVGTVSAACFAQQGHNVIGVDPIAVKVEMINMGVSPIIEKDIGRLIEDNRNAKRLSATQDTYNAIASSTISFICVGTPSEPNGNLGLRFLRRVCEEIGLALKVKTDWHLIVIRSTILPGTMNEVVIKILEEISGKKAGDEFGVCHNPEFLREGSAVYDFFHPPKTVIGESEPKSGELLASLYSGIEDAPLIRTTFQVSEMVKYVDNIWHGLKVSFANEIGNICKVQKVDSHEVMQIFCQDQKLNISPSYLKPGFAFGGSCLPKDIRAMSYKAKILDIEIPIINSILPSNKLQLEKALQMVFSKGKKKIGILGFSFKAGTDDLRESPMVEMIERLIGKGYELKLYDRNVNLASLIGANRDYILNRIPHISKLMVEDMGAVVEHAELVVIGNGDPEFSKAIDIIPKNVQVIDLVRIDGTAQDRDGYDGICW